MLGSSGQASPMPPGRRGETLPLEKKGGTPKVALALFLWVAVVGLCRRMNSIKNQSVLAWKAVFQGASKVERFKTTCHDGLHSFFV